MAGEEEDYGSARITIELDDADAVADARDVGLRIQRALDRATRNIGNQIRDNIERGMAAASVSVRVAPDLSRFDGQLLAGLRGFESLNLPVAPDLTGFVEAVRARLAGGEVSVRVTPDFSDFDERVRRHEAPDVPVGVDASRLSRALAALTGVAGRTGSALGSLLSFGAVGIAAAGAAQGVAALTAALAPLGGLVAALPAAVLGAQAALGTLRLAIIGVSDALSAAVTGSAAEYTEAIKNLAPAAQQAVGAIRALAPDLTALQQAVQQRFFAQFASDVSAAVTTLLPLQTQLGQIATQFGLAAAAGLQFAASGQAAGPLREILAGTAQAASGLQTAIAPVAKGILDVGAAIATAFGAQVGAQIGQLGAQFGTWLSTLAASGQAVEMVRSAVATFAQLGAIASNVGSVLSGVFGAASAAGGGFLNNLQTITASMAAFVNSAAGQQALGSIFGALAQAAAQVGPIISALVTQVGAIAPALGQVFATIGPAITGLFNAIGPALSAIMPGVQAVAQGLAQAFDSVGPALAPLGAAFGQILSGLAPILPVVAQLAAAFASALAPVLSAIAPLIQPIIGAFQQFAPIVVQLVSTLSAALLPVISALVPVISQLLAPVVELGAAIGQALVPIIQALSPILTALAPALANLALAFMPVVNVIVQLAPILTPIITLIGQLVAWVLRLITPLIQLIAPIINVIAQFFAINRAVGTVIGWLGRLVGWATRLGASIANAASRIGQAASSITSFFSNLFSRISGIVSSLVSRVPAAFSSLMSRAGSFVSSGVSRVVSFFSGLWGRLSGVLSSLGGNVVSFFRGLPARVVVALGNLNSRLVSAGRDLIRGMINGVRQMAGQIASAAKEVVSGAITAAKNALGISSPSKVFAEIGRDTGAGFIKGLTGTTDQIKSTIDKMVKDITAAFKGKKTRIDDQLVKMLQEGNTQLQKLAKERDALAKRIADAIKFASETAASALQAFSLQNLTQGGDITKLSIIEGLEGAIKQVKDFTKQINNLGKRGLRKDLLEQIIALGPQQGAQLAEFLAGQSSSTLKQINNLQSQLVSATTKLGRDSADNLFDAGKKASEGFLTGLKAQQKDIEKLMVDIAKAMQKAIRKALGIKSPSRVFARIGDQTGQGLQLGLLGRISSLQEATRKAARAVAAAATQPLAGIGTSGAVPGFRPALAAVNDGTTVPLTRPTRTRRAADADTLTDLIRGARTRQTSQPGLTANFTIQAATDPEKTAQTVLRRLARLV